MARGEKSTAKIPPNNLEAEHAILGVMLLEGHAAVDVALGLGLQEGDFYGEGNRIICRAIAKLHSEDVVTDMISVSAELRRTAEFEMVGGAPKLALLVEQASLAAYIERYVGIVMELAKKRHLMAAAIEAYKAAADLGQSADEVAGSLEATLDDVRRRAMPTDYDPAVHWRSLVQSWQRGVMKLGIAELDARTGGITRGQIVVNGGRTSQGKTAWTTDRAVWLAKNGTRVDIISLEDDEEAMTRRLVANVAGVSLVKLRDGSLTPYEFAHAEAAIKELQALPLRVIGMQTIRASDDRTVLGAISLSRAEKIVLDHVQKVQVRRAGRDELQTYAIKRLMDRMHTIAQRDRKVLAINAQLSRETDRDKRPPFLSDLADSSALEQAARQVHLLYWPWKHTPAKREHHEYEVYVAKNTEGGTGKVDLQYRAAAGRFGDPMADLG